jgi:hypothetical protein
MPITWDRRPLGEQVKSGFKIAGAIAGSIALLAMFGGGYLRVTEPQRHQAGFAAWMMMAGAVLVLILTESQWSRWFCYIPGGIGGRGLIAISMSLLFGTAKGIADSYFWLIFCLLSLAMCLLSFRFQKSTQLSLTDRVTLLLSCLCFLVTLSRMMAGMNDKLLIGSIGLGDVFLLPGWVYYYLRNRKSQRKRKLHLRGLWADWKSERTAPTIQTLDIGPTQPKAAREQSTPRHPRR